MVRNEQLLRDGKASHSPCIWMSARPIHGVAFLYCWFTLKGVCCCCEEIWSKRKVFEDDVFIENTHLVGDSKTQDLNLRVDLVWNMSRGPPGQWFSETEYWASAIFVGTSGIPPKIIYRSVKSYTTLMPYYFIFACEIWLDGVLICSIRPSWQKESQYSRYHWIPTSPSFYAPCIRWWWVRYIDQPEYFPRIGSGVENVSFNTILLRASAFYMSHPFLYHRIYWYADNISANLWIRPEANSGFAFVFPNCSNRGLWSVTTKKCWPYSIWWNSFTSFTTAKPSLSICA